MQDPNELKCELSLCILQQFLCDVESQQVPGHSQGSRLGPCDLFHTVLSYNGTDCNSYPLWDEVRRI